MEDLYLGMNYLTNLPKEIAQLTILMTLDLGMNNLTSLPKEIGQLTNLKQLNLSGNQLTYLPKEIGQLTNLKQLNLSGNQLTSLPREIGQLTNLKTLYLNNNQLTSLPKETGQLTNLTELDLSGCPLTSPPTEIVERGIPAIFEYLSQSTDTLVNEAKLIFVGQGDVGKTCLAQCLIHGAFHGHETTTEGIDIAQWTINAPTNENEEIKLNVWDFGGQEIYHSTHQFFLTKRSLYSTYSVVPVLPSNLISSY